MKNELPLGPYLVDVVGSTTFAYFLFVSLAEFYVNGYTTRVSLFGFLIPHASKLALWSFMALVWLRPRFGWRFPFALLMLYSIAELTTNWIYVPVHIITQGGYIWQLLNLNKNYYFPLSNIFFILAIILSRQFLNGRYSFNFDWSIMPFVAFIGIWISQGYITDSTVLVVNPLIELYEFLWSVLYLTMMYYCFKPMIRQPDLLQRPFVG